MSDGSILLVVAGFVVKHFIADGLLQTSQMVRDKAVYGKPLGILHAAIHGFGTAAVMLLFGAGLVPSLMLAIVDFLLHYHIDFAKEQIVKRNGWTSLDSRFWWSISADQMLHYFTYLALVAYAFTSSSA